MRAGAVVELLAKALLSACDERLIAKGDAVHDHLLDLALAARGKNAATSTRREARSVQTVDARVAVGLAARLDDEVSKHMNGAQAVLKARNDAVHLAIPKGPEALSDVVDEMSAFASAAVGALGYRTTDFWGDLADSVDLRARQRRRIMLERVMARIASARAAYEQVLGRIPHDARAAVIAILQERAEHGALDAPVACPACGQEALVRWDADVDIEYDHGEVLYHSQFLLTGLHCPVCDLRLDGDEIEALKLELPDVDELAATVYDDAYHDH